MDSSLMKKLPGELRNNIYALVVFVPEGYHFLESGRRGVWRRKDVSDNSSDADLLAITKTCKQMRQESLGVFYSINTFTFYPRMWCLGFKMTRSQMRSYSADLGTLRRWLKSIGKDNAASIKNLVLDLEEWTPTAPQARQQNHPLHLVPVPTEQWNREWWRMARKLERKLLHRYVKPACIKVSVDVKNVTGETHAALRRIAPDLFRDLVHDRNRLCLVHSYTTYLVPTTSKSEAVKAVRRTYQRQNDILDENLRQTGVDPGSRIRTLLRSATELNRDLMLNAVGEEVKQQDLSDRLAALSLTRGGV